MTYPANPPQSLRLVSYLASTFFSFYRDVGNYLSQTARIDVDVAPGQYDPLEDPARLADEVGIACMDGLTFLRLDQAVPGQWEPLVAPVMRGERYSERPIYFSDVIVRADSGLRSFEDLRGKQVCYNHPNSTSGYHMLRDFLVRTQRVADFFRTAIQSGSHQRSIDMVVEGQADCAAIDSTVLERTVRLSPHLATRLHVLKSIGPAPIPPLIISQRLGPALIERLRAALLSPGPDMQRSMDLADVSAFASVETRNYAMLQVMVERAKLLGDYTLW